LLFDLVSRAPRGASCLAFVPSIAIPINARDVQRGMRASSADRKAFLMPVLSPCASHGIARTDGAPTTGADMTPQFRSGQTVRLSRGLPYKSAADGDYKIIRQLPDNGGEQQYRIKSVREPHERVVKESDLEKV
jgi:hypothetical protein